MLRPILRPSLFIVFTSALLHPERFQTPEDASPMARREDFKLQEALVREVLAVIQGVIASLLETRGVLGQAEGEQPLYDLLAGL